MKRTLTLLLLIASVACYAQKAKLELNLKLDSTYYLTTNVSMIMVEDMPNNKMVFTMIVGGKMSHKVIAIKDSVYELAASYENMTMSLDLGGKKMMDINTGLNQRDPISNMMSAMLHKPITIVINKKGVVLEIKNTDSLYTHMFDGFPQVTEEKKAQFKKQMQSSFGAEALKNNFQDAFAVFPSLQVGINDSWVSNTEMRSVIKAKIRTTYTLKSITDHNYLVHGDAVVQPGELATYAELNGFKMRWRNVKGNCSMDVKLDKTTGWISECKTTKRINADVDLKDSPGIPGGMTFPISIAADLSMDNK
jgi:hypothetical protein